MTYIFLLTGIALHIVKANDWFVVPTFCIVFCYIFGFICSMIEYTAKNIGKEIARRIKVENKKDE